MRDRVRDLLPSCVVAGSHEESEEQEAPPHFVLTPSEMRYVDPMNRFTLDPGQGCNSIVKNLA